MRVTVKFAGSLSTSDIHRDCCSVASVKSAAPQNICIYGISVSLKGQVTETGVNLQKYNLSDSRTSGLSFKKDTQWVQYPLLKQAYGD